jgi:NTP pyrophosphatase (non-canonical NTP hydrolase)
MKELDIHQTQASVEGWQRNLENTGIEQSIEIRAIKFLEEAQEVIMALKDYESDPDGRKNLSGELGDVIITTCSIASYYGIDMNEVVEGALTKVWGRINPETIRKLQEEGLSGKELYQRAKKDFDQKSKQ